MSTKGDWTKLEQQNQSNAAALKVFKDALQSPPPDTGWIWAATNHLLSAGPPRNFARDRALAYGLASTEIGQLHHGDLASALTDLHALIAMTQVNRNELTLVHSMIRLAIAGVATRATWEALQAPGWDETTLASIQHAWEQVNLVEGLERGGLGERALGLRIFEKMRHASRREFSDMTYGVLAGTKPSNRTFPQRFWEEQVRIPLYRVNTMDADELLFLQHSTKVLKLFQMLNESRPAAEINLACSNIMQEFTTNLTNGNRDFIISAMMIPNWSTAIQRVSRTVTQQRLAILAIAIKRHELKYGKPPANLAALIPEFLAKDLIDPMSGKSFCYRVNPDATYILYSTGDDGIDDGGKAGSDFWSSPDAVWPTVAPDSQ